MDIGPITDLEFEAAIELWRRCGLLEPGQDPLEDIRRNQTAADGDLLVGRIGGVMRATAMVGFDGHRAWAYYVAVEPGLQRSGLGRVMVAAAEDWARDRGAPKLMLMVGETNTQVLGFYEALGFDRRPVLPLAKPLV